MPKAAIQARNILGDKPYQRRARAALPILVSAAASWDTLIYQDLARRLNMPNPRNLDYVLGCIGREIEVLANLWKVEIPPIEIIVINKSESLPGRGADPFLKRIKDRVGFMDRHGLVSIAQDQVFQYPQWRAVQAAILRSSQFPTKLSGIPFPGEGATGEDAVNGPTLDRAMWARRDISETMKMRLVSSRVGQGAYRDNVMQIEKRCRITGIADRQYLRASHIKPWCKSTDLEKLDGYNGLLLSPHVDLLFDHGWISFSNNGKLLLSAKLAPTVLVAWGIPKDLNVGEFRAEQRKYLAWHREAYGFWGQDGKT
jgi:HNH endonuclease